MITFFGFFSSGSSSLSSTYIISLFLFLINFGYFDFFFGFLISSISSSEGSSINWISFPSFIIVLIFGFLVVFFGFLFPDASSLVSSSEDFCTVLLGSLLVFLGFDFSCSSSSEASSSISSSTIFPSFLIYLFLFGFSFLSIALFFLTFSSDDSTRTFSSLIGILIYFFFIVFYVIFLFFHLFALWMAFLDLEFLLF